MDRPTLLRGVFARYAAVVVGATALLIIAPVSISEKITPPQLALLLVGLAVMLLAFLILLRRALAPLSRLTGLMRRIDPLQPGQRIAIENPPAEVADLTQAFNDMLDRLEGERRDSARRALAAQEDERSRIARELHDEIGQTLTGLLLRSESLARRASPDLKQDLEELRDAARRGAEDARGIARRLRPEALDELGLISALTNLADRTAVTVELDLDEDIALDREEELVVYRVAQESLTNVVRHSGSDRAVLALQREGGSVTLRVRDDGAGIPPLAAGSGIRGMRERALLIGARLTVEGSEIRLEIPDDANPAR